LVEGWKRSQRSGKVRNMDGWCEESRKERMRGKGYHDVSRCMSTWERHGLEGVGGGSKIGSRGGRGIKDQERLEIWIGGVKKAGRKERF
jgi:hypothetical protein